MACAGDGAKDWRARKCFPRRHHISVSLQSAAALAAGLKGAAPGRASDLTWINGDRPGRPGRPTHLSWVEETSSPD